MADVIRNEDGQLMLLTVFMILIGVVGYTAILNSMIFSANLQSTGLEESKQEIRDLRLITEAEIIKAAYYANTTPYVSDPTNHTQVSEYFYNYITSFNNTIQKIYSARGASVEIIVNNISLNATTSNMTVNKYFIEWKNHTFPVGSLVIPMDENQTQLMKVYGLVYKIVDKEGSAPLNSTRIPVWTILQNPVNYSVANFSSTMYTDDNASTAVDNLIQDRYYSGGPFLIDLNELDNYGGTEEGNKQLIIDEAKNKSITVHELKSSFYYDKAIQMVVPPKVAVYPDPPGDEMETYYKDGEVPYTVLDDNEIKNGNLTQFDILTIPHQNMNSASKKDVVIAIEAWVANGGVIHSQCLGTDSMDAAVEKYANRKPWYGFIGINRSNNDDITKTTMTYVKLLDKTTPFNVSPYNASYSFNMSPPISLSGLADPGAAFSPLAQSHNKSGILGYMGASSTTQAFSLRSNASQVNPAANILGYAAYANGTPVYVDDDPSPDINVPTFIYIEAPYENGLVTYLAGHNQTQRVGGERLIFETFFAASMRLSLVTGITAKNINVTIKYFDGNVRYTDTFIINT